MGVPVRVCNKVRSHIECFAQTLSGDTGHLNIKDMIRNTPMTFNAEYNVRFTDMAIKLLLFQNLYFIPIETYTAGLK